MFARTMTTTAALTACVLVSGAGLTTAVARQQSRANWRYAYVVFRTTSSAQICFVESGGCRYEEIVVDPVPMQGEVLMTDGGATRGLALTKAVSTLGSRGWEMVLEAPAVHDASKNAIYFKQPY